MKEVHFAQCLECILSRFIQYFLQVASRLGTSAMKEGSYGFRRKLKINPEEGNILIYCLNMNIYINIYIYVVI